MMNGESEQDEKTARSTSRGPETPHRTPMRGTSDNEDSSDSEAEIDVGDYEKRRETNLRRLLVLEKQFAKLRDELYKERMQQVERRQAELLDRVATDCVRKLALLEEEHARRLQVSEMVRRFQLEEMERVNAGRVETVHMDFENDKELLYDRVEADIREQVDRLKQEKLEADVSLALWMAGDAQRGKSKKKKPIKRRQLTVTGPYVVYLAKEEDIDADWLAIRRATIEADICDRIDQS